MVSYVALAPNWEDFFYEFPSYILRSYYMILLQENISYSLPHLVAQRAAATATKPSHLVMALFNAPLVTSFDGLCFLLAAWTWTDEVFSREQIIYALFASFLWFKLDDWLQWQ